MVKQFLSSSMLGLSQRTWNGSMRRFACLEAAGQLFLRKMRGQERRPPTREACLLTPHLARSNSSTAYA
jgi:hypothetical protein